MTNSIGITMCPIEPGTFTMGERNPIPETKPSHRNSLRVRKYQSCNLDHPKGYMELDSMNVPKWEWDGDRWGASLKGVATAPVTADMDREEPYTGNSYSYYKARTCIPIALAQVDICMSVVSIIMLSS